MANLLVFNFSAVGRQNPPLGLGAKSTSKGTGLVWFNFPGIVLFLQLWTDVVCPSNRPCNKLDPFDMFNRIGKIERLPKRCPTADFNAKY